MALTRVRFELENDRQYSRGFLMAATEAEDLTAPLTGTADVVREAVGDQFATEGGRSKRWRPLNGRYARWKASNAPIGPAAPMLVFTGEMRAAALARTAFKITPRRLVYEIDDDKAAHHQGGHGRLPERKLINLTGMDRRAIDREFVEWLNELRRGIIRGR